MTEIIEKDTIKIYRTWHCDDIRNMCIRHNWYDAGSNSEYENMLEMVHDNEPNYENIFCVADNIRVHSTDEDLKTTTIMYYIEHEVVITNFIYKA